MRPSQLTEFAPNMSRERRDLFQGLLNASRIGVLDGGFVRTIIAHGALAC